MFSVDKFQAAQYCTRTERVAVPALREYFDEGEEPVFIVRGLDASELNRAQEASNKQAHIDTLVKAIASQKDQVELIRKALGMSTDVPGEIAKRIELLVQGSVEPAINHAVAVKLATVHPIEFYDLSNRITVLTGAGGDRVKPSPSSQTTEAS